MFDGLLKRKFQTKCKSAIKITKTRIEMIKRKRNAMQKYLKNDIADLLRNNLDTNAYHRAEGLLIELNLSTCYDVVEQCCVCISNHLSTMNKQRECPEECREAVPSLMFAAARIADLPELRDLRTIFTERYQNSLDLYVNKEFVHKLKLVPPTKDMKLQLLQDIALESGVEWDIKALGQKLYNPPASDQDWSKNTDERLEEPLFKDIQVASINHKIGQRNDPDFEQRISDNKEFGNQKPFSYTSIPPPYTKPKAGKNETSFGKCLTPTKLNDTFEEADLKPKSVTLNIAKGEGKMNLCGTVKEDEKHGLKILNEDGQDQRDEEEMMMDKLLIHYSKKKPPYKPDKAEISTLKLPPSQGGAAIDTTSKTIDGPPERATSLPVETTSPTGETKGHARASSFQPEMLNTKGHVHPKLPEYDDFVARLASLSSEK